MAMHKFTHPEDSFIIAAPTYKTMQQATLPAFLQIMQGLGTYNKADAVFEMHGGGKCYMRTATDPNSVVGITNCRHIWGDEAGLFPLYFHENLQARAAFKQAPICYTSSPYSLNWIFTDYIRPWHKSGGNVPGVEIIQARSDENPYFPKAEFERKKATMDPRRFNMMFGGEFHKLEGLVYDCFDEDSHVVEQMPINAKPTYIAGLDWGYTHPCVINVFAVDPFYGIYLVHEFYETGKTISEVIQAAKAIKHRYGDIEFLCDPSQPAHIAEMGKHGLKAFGANNDIRAGIDAMYEFIASGKFHVLKGAGKNFLDEISIYHYPHDENLKPDQNSKDQLPVKQHDDSCLGPDSLIKTPQGEVPINKIQPGMIICSPFGTQKVIDCGITGVRWLHEEKNTGLIMTLDHSVMSLNKGFDWIDKDTIVPTWKISRIIMGRSIIGTANILLRLAAVLMVARFCTDRFGLTIMEKFLLAIIFITKTTTSEITISKISNAYRLLTILDTTARKKLLKIQSGLKLSKQKELKLLRRGIRARKVGLGIGSMERMFSAIGLKSKRYVKYATLLTGQTRLIAPGFARILASHLIGVQVVLMIFLKTVKDVLTFSKKTNMRNLAFAPSLVQKDIREPVYNLTTEHGCFYANNLLVSNCDATRYVMLHLKNTHFNIKKTPTAPGATDKDLRHHYQDSLLLQGIDQEHDW